MSGRGAREAFVTYLILAAFFFFTSLWVWLDAPEYGMTRWWGMGVLVLWIVFMPLYLVVRWVRGYDDTPQPQLLGNGDILVPITEDGRTTMALLKPGDEEHAAWLGHVQHR